MAKQTEEARTTYPPEVDALAAFRETAKQTEEARTTYPPEVDALRSSGNG